MKNQDKAVERLCQAIIVQAAKDYRRALSSLKRDPKSRYGLGKKQELERFFRSKWYKAMTDVDGEFLIIKLQEEFE
ncbi:MAG: hypothetical protein LUH03_10755 [Oscillospiraceae bacterium]|nr:hypothetical protein [Oscillospiraceae bacterium]